MDVEDGVSVSGGTACQSVSQSVNGVWSTMDVEPVSAPSSPMSTEEAPSAEEMTSRAEPHLLGIDEAGRGCVTPAHPNQPLARRGSRAVPWWTLPRATPAAPSGRTRLLLRHAARSGRFWDPWFTARPGAQSRARRR